MKEMTGIIESKRLKESGLGREIRSRGKRGVLKEMTGIIESKRLKEIERE